MTIIRRATFPADTAAILHIWREFIASSPVDLSYQNNDREFATLPGNYAEPAGCVLLADCRGEIDGCVAIRRIDDAICEMKRLYVRPSARGRGLGQELAARLIVTARLAGYREMRLDVMAQSSSARRLYDRLGFAPAAPVSCNPVLGASFLGLRL